MDANIERTTMIAKEESSSFNNLLMAALSIASNADVATLFEAFPYLWDDVSNEVWK